MNHCETCKHWDKTASTESEDGICDRLGGEDSGLYAFVTWEGSADTYETTKDFGCVHWERLTDEK